MTPEQRPTSPPTNQPEHQPTEFNPYQEAMVIYELVVEFLQQRGELRRATDITSEEDQDDHFDDLARVYKQTLLFLGLDWSPPAIDEAEDGETP